MPADAQRILFVVTEDWYFVSHRLPLAAAAIAAGHRVAVATRVRNHAERIVSAGIELLPLTRLRRSSVNPLRELAALAELAEVMRRWQPQIVHLVALKPVIYGALAARLGARGVARVNALAGLGFVFVQGRKLARLLRPLVKLALRWALRGRRAITIVQNPDDRDLLVSEGLVDPLQVRLIRGSGVDLQRFRVTPLPPGPPVVLLMARILWDKGVAEFVEAARLVRLRGVEARFVLVGEPDQENPAAVPREILRRWNESGLIEWWGFRNDVPEVIAQARIVVLPSYYGEGVPKVLLEAAACGRPMIATDMPGCREVVEDGITGVLVPPRDAGGLADAVFRLLSSPEACSDMARRARALVERDFGIETVVTATLDTYRVMIGD